MAFKSNISLDKRIAITVGCRIKNLPVKNHYQFATIGMGGYSFGIFIFILVSFVCLFQYTPPPPLREASSRSLARVLSQSLVPLHLTASTVLLGQARPLTELILPLIEILKFDWLRQILYAAILCFLTNLIFLIYPLHVTY